MVAGKLQNNQLKLSFTVRFEYNNNNKKPIGVT